MHELMSKKKIAIGAIIVILIVILAGIIVPHRPEKSEYRTVKVGKGELVSTVSATGTP